MPTPRGGRKMSGPMGNETAQQDIKDADLLEGGSLSAIKCQIHMP